MRALADGRVLGRTRISGDSDDGGRTDREGYYRFEAAYEVLAADDTMRVPLGRYPDLEMAELLYQGVMLHLGLPFSRRARDASWGNLVVIGSTDRYEFHAYDGSGGSLVRIVRRDHAYRVPTRDEVTAATEEFIEDEVPEQHASMVRGAVAEAPMVEMLPAFRAVLGDALGHLWVEEYVLAGAGATGAPVGNSSAAEAAAPLWTVFDPEGRALGFVETPAGLTLFEIGADYVLGLATDELGIERVQVWALERG